MSIDDRMVEALKKAKKLWEKAEMPTIYASSEKETGKIALAMIAIKLFDEGGSN